MEPLPKNDTGYKLWTDMHFYKWIEDLLSATEWNFYKAKYGKNKQKTQRVILKEDGINFGRDCCFKMENLHFSHKNNPKPIPLDETMLDLIISELDPSRLGKENAKQDPPDTSSPFGYNIKGHRYGRLDYVELENNKAITFIEHLLKSKENAK